MQYITAGWAHCTASISKWCERSDNRAITQKRPSIPWTLLIRFPITAFILRVVDRCKANDSGKRKFSAGFVVFTFLYVLSFSFVASWRHKFWCSHIKKSLSVLCDKIVLYRELMCALLSTFRSGNLTPSEWCVEVQYSGDAVKVALSGFPDSEL